ncbi:MAG: hypothetical protein GEV28_00440 [Actinophytocola sp.]|uniref:polymorphic toxin-type HINT domain-containing protein n=1 Tax=Actinophytocola sp. TaxID=1872138 RepID=UPI00132B6F47|nr:polymorphic toxin-type HINT domain-containing protein [Actinophytocola sp.]MPZ78938.1 hypothetical protein [Actinophytocola sp.]
MTDGTSKPIEDVEVGDEVLATDPATGQSDAHEVVATIVGHGWKNVVELTFDVDGVDGSRTATLAATDHHVLWADDLGGWVAAGDLPVGSNLRGLDGDVELRALARHVRNQEVYNLTVSGVHTYYVLSGPVPVLARNDDGGNDLSRETVRLLAMRMAGIPVDAEPVDIIRNASGVQYVYDMDGRNMLVTENTMDRSHPGQPHWEAGEMKQNQQVDNHGRWRVANNKIKVNFSSEGC